MPQADQILMTAHDVVMSGFFQAGMADASKKRAMPIIYDKLNKEQQNLYKLGRQLVAANPVMNIRDYLEVKNALVQAAKQKDLLV